MRTLIASESLRDYFDARVARGAEDECWPWQGVIMKVGYGQVGLGGRKFYAHRVSYTLHHGPIPPGLHICHRRDNPPCVNPAHLFAGTAAENMADMRRKGRARNTPKPGEKHHAARLTNEQVLEIRRRCAAGESQMDLAAEFGVANTTVSMIHRRATWRHL